MSPTPSPRRPDILLVVLDCVRASDVPGTSARPVRMPFVEGLLRESTVYTHAVAPSPWTVPTHGSLFTGLTPADHGAHAMGPMVVGAGVPRLPSSLARAGYRTCSLSANHLVGTDLGMVEGFHEASWGTWWHSHLRLPALSGPPHRAGSPGAAHSSLTRLRQGALSHPFDLVARVGLRHPILLDLANRTARSVRRASGPPPGKVAAWIEPELRAWLGRVPPDVPTFTFVNLLDAHEPYFPSPGEPRGGRQDRASLIAGQWRPTVEELAPLHEVYRGAVASLDGRLEALVDAMKAAGRWENTLLVVTSDHGQSFGEHGMLFHMHRLDEPLLRVPLWVRPPVSASATVHRWVSLIDLVPTLCEAAGAPAPPTPAAWSLARTEERPAAATVVAMADGLAWGPLRQQIGPAARARWDRPWVAGYRGRWKFVWDPRTGEAHAYDIERDPGEVTERWGEDDPVLRELAQEVRRASRGFPPEREGGVEERLLGWGYA